jgi:hypothetical protein
MEVDVRGVTWPAGSGGEGIAEYELRWTMFEIPESGSRYWHGRGAFQVLVVDDLTDPPTVNLEHDAEWEQELLAELPAGYWLDGGRQGQATRYTVAVDTRN